MKNFIFLILISNLLAFSTLSSSVSAQMVEPISDQSIEYLFAEFISFEATINLSSEVLAAEVFFQESNSANTYVLSLDVDESNRVTGNYDISKGLPITVFSTIQYWFRITLEDNKLVESDFFQFFYEDNRFEWTKLEQLPIVVNTYQEDLEFSQAIQNAAQKGLQDAKNLLGLPAPDVIQIYVYSKVSDLQSALNITSQSWVAAHSDPANGIVMVSIAPGPEQNVEIGRQVPHEVAHIALYQAYREGYDDIPNWLNEGVASKLENSPDPEYEKSLQAAAQNSQFIPMIELCNSFPIDQESAILAYSQSSSFVNYIFDQVGSTGLSQLLSNYANGAGCENGTIPVLNIGLSQLERQWRNDVFQENSTASALSDLFPWFGLMLIILAAPIGIMLFNKLNS